MKILIVTPACHFKSAGAAQRDIYAAVTLIKRMGHEVIVYTIDSSAQDAEIIAERSRSLGVIFKKHFPDENLIKKIKLILSDWKLFDGSARVFACLSKDQVFLNFLDDWKPQVIFSFCSYSWPILRLANQHGIGSVFRSHNFESSFFWESLDLIQKFNPFNWLRYWCKEAGEKLAARYSTIVASLPLVEIPKYQSQNNQVEILSLLFLPKVISGARQQTPKQPLDIFYLGASYNVIFHRRGVELLIKEIAPRVLKEYPEEFRFHICGSKLPPRLASLCVGNIIYEGYVPDLEAFLSRMDIGVFPVMTGTTMKGKVFESLARAFPSVISSNCKGGYNLAHRQEVLVADTIQDFADQIISLRDVALRQSLSNNAFAFSQKEFGEQKTVTTINKILQACVV